VTGWQDLHDEGVRLLLADDVAAGRAALERARRVAVGEQLATTLVNLAAAADLAGDPAEAVDLLAEAAGAAGPGPRGAAVLATRARVLADLGRWEEAWQDAERGSADAEPHERAVLHDVRAGLLIAAGRWAEAEVEALAAVDLGLTAAPEVVVDAYAKLADICEATGDHDRARSYREHALRPGGVRPVDPRWQESVRHNARGAALAAAGRVADAAAAFDAAHGATLGSDDAQALVCRAAAAGNLAGAAASLGRSREAIAWNTEAVESARAALARVGDEYGTAGVLANALLARAQLLRHASRHAEALADLDEASALAGGEPSPAGDGGPARAPRPPVAALRPSIVAVRASVLAACGRFGEAAAEARAALDLAYGSAPEPAAFAHLALAEIAGATGDRAGGAEHLGLARDLAAATGDRTTGATALTALARSAYLDDDHDRAAALYDEAEALLREAGDDRAIATCLHGRAAVEVRLGRPEVALGLLDRVLAEWGDDATPVGLIAVDQVRGAALEESGRYAAADECYGRAVAVAERAGLWHVALGVAWWRADALVRWASTVDGERRRELCARSLDLALPAALAAEAVRQRFAHGPLRERWVALAAAPAVRAALTAVASLGDVELAAAYVDHLAGTVSLSPDGDRRLPREELVALPAPPVTEEDHLPHAASFVAGAEDDPAFPATGFALPPRVRVDPAEPSALDPWIDVAERRYGFPVRAGGAVASW